jgi:LacI family transcriptional regulator
MQRNDITIKDIAELANVGVSTVSRVMHDHPDVSEKTRERVKKIISLYGYIPNASAQNLKIAESNNIGVLIKAAFSPFFSTMIDTIEAIIVKKGYSMVLMKVGISEDEIKKAELLVKEKRLSGVVFLGGSFSHTEEKLAKLGCPFVFVTTTQLSCRSEAFSSVYVNDTKEAYKAVEYLISLGHRKPAILLVKTEALSIIELRLNGYKQALEHHGIDFNENWIITAENFSMKASYDITKQAIERTLDCTAIFAISDVLAVGAIKALTDSGFTVPDDMSLIGFDGQDIAFYYDPTIATISQPVEQMAQKAAGQLFELIHGEKHRQIEFNGILIKGGSCIAAR